MQDPSLYSHINAQQVQHPQQQVQPFPEQEHLKCPRCDSDNTKFCYYNNYNLSQPRHFCKSCRRYWTKGGTLRNIPVGGGSRKNAKRSSASSSPSSSSSSAAKRPASAPPSESKTDDDGRSQNDGEVTDKMSLKGDGFEGHFGDFMGTSGSLSFSSLMESNEGQFSNFLDGPSSGLQMGLDDHFGEPGSRQNMGPNGLGSGCSNNNNNGDGFLNIPGGDNDNSGGWSGGSNVWPDLSMYTPGSNYL